jgi:Tfp pilus assembly protein PilE
VTCQQRDDSSASVVVVIIGILAAIAIPKFSVLVSDGHPSPSARCGVRYRSRDKQSDRIRRR